MKKLSFFWQLLFLKKNYWHFEFLINHIFGRRLIIFEKLRYRSELLLKLRTFEVATSFHWISSKSTQYYQAHKNSSKLNNIIFWRPPSKGMSAKSLKFFDPPTRKWRPCKIFAKLNGNHLLMANIFKLHKYQTFCLMEMKPQSSVRFGI